MGRILDAWRGFWSHRAARYQAATLREQAEVKRHARIAELTGKESKTGAELYELGALLEGTGDALWGGWDRVLFLQSNLDRYQFSMGGPGFPIGTPPQRKDGNNWPFYQNETDLGIFLTASRLAFSTITKAEGLIYGLAGYVIGDGVTVRCLPKHPGAEELAKQAQAVIDSFRLVNEMDEREEDFFVHSRRDGEGIWRLFPQEDGTTQVREVWPEQIRQPKEEDFETWGFGVKCDPEDAEKRVEFAVHPTTGDVTDCDYVPADEMVFMPINVDRGIKRGVPDLAWGFLEAVKASYKLSTNMGAGSAQQAAIAYIRQHTGMDRTTVQAFATADADYKRQNPHTGADINIKEAIPGTIVDTTRDTEFLGSPYNAGIAAHVDVVRLLDRVACVKYNAPEWLGSADSSNNNFASGIVAEAPFTLRVKAFQRKYSRPFRRTHERVLVIAAEAGKLPANVLEHVEVKVTFPNPVPRNRMEEAQRSAAMLQVGTVSPQIVTEEAGYDWEKVRKDWKEAQAQGWTPPGGGSGGATGQGGGPAAGVNRISPSANGNGTGLQLGSNAMSSLLGESLQEGFTGTRKDSLGREYHYVDGVRVESADDVQAAQPAAKSESHLSKLLSRIAEVPQAVREKVGGFVQRKYEQLTTRYGKKGAVAVLAASIALLPVPVPGTSLVPIAMAEAIVRIRRAVVAESDEGDEYGPDVAEGFTGTKTDSLGREYHYVDGVRVASEQDVEAATGGETGGGGESVLSDEEAKVLNGQMADLQNEYVHLVKDRKGSSKRATEVLNQMASISQRFEASMSASQQDKDDPTATVNYMGGYRSDHEIAQARKDRQQKTAGGDVASTVTRLADHMAQWEKPEGGYDSDKYEAAVSAADSLIAEHLKPLSQKELFGVLSKAGVQVRSSDSRQAMLERAKAHLTATARSWLRAQA